MRNWNPNDDRSSDLAHGYARHLARTYGDDPLCSHCQRCENCGTSGGHIVEIWTDDGTRAWLCEDCAEEVRRLERVAEELAAMAGCEVRDGIVERAETTAGLVNCLRAHDMAECSVCAVVRRKAAVGREAASATSHPGSGKVA